jgi:hypothetical protein
VFVASLARLVTLRVEKARWVVQKLSKGC